MLMTSHQDLESAEITITALECIATHKETWAGYIGLPDARAVHRSEIIEKLATSSKPLLCFGLRIAGCLAIASWSSSGPAWGGPRVVDTERFESTGLVLVSAEHASRLLNVNSLQAWRRDFYLPQIDFSILDASDSARRAGAQYEILFAKASDTRSAVAWLR
jgi:hypothetical protein